MSESTKAAEVLATPTPGPWEHKPRARDGHADMIAYKGKLFVQVGCPRAQLPILDYPHENEQTANARLIAAAPELLEALDQARGFMESCARAGTLDEDDMQTIKQIDAALDKARGQS